MWIIIVLLIVAIAILLVDLSYKNHCIDDLETRVSRMRKLQSSEILDLLFKLQEIQNGDYGRASRDTLMRNAINENIEKYSEQKRRLDRADNKF